MAVFVDELVEYGAGFYKGADAAQAERVGRRNGHQWCHLFSDEKDPAFPELHRFAATLGMKREWFQGDHYDLTPRRRDAALRVGARAVTRHEAVAIWKTTPRARRFRCRACDHVTERLTAPPERCSSCGLGGDVVVRRWPPEDGREWDSQCARCGSSTTRLECENCGGEGMSSHDCGEDSCCCADPDELNVRCDVCQGQGAWMVCLSDAAWCEANPAPGREKVKRGAIEWFVIERGGPEHVSAPMARALAGVLRRGQVDGEG